MPALSPTMTEGNISAWRVKEGESFSAGDVLLEIETDKATMDVEAQDDGILVKIMSPDESKGVKVGHRIAVTAEAGDDVSSLEIPAEDTSASAGQPARKDRPTPQEETAGGLDTTESSPSSAESPPSSKPNADAAAGGAADTTPSTQKKSQGGKAQKQTYPLYPAVQHLLQQNGLSKADADNIPASGPAGRLLKGDVLAYLGKIKQDYPASVSARLDKLAHLDLSNIQLAAPPPPAPKPSKPEPAVPELPKETEIALPISLTAVLATQKRVQEALGITLPLSTFIARATELANDALPLSKNQTPTAEDLFNSVLGLDSVSSSKTSRGSYIPQVTALSQQVLTRPAKKADIIDMLAPQAAKTKKPSKIIPAATGAGSAMTPNVFSVSAKGGEERRAMEFLERIKDVLEKEPGRLVL